MPFGNLSGPTLLVILFIVLLLFGAPKLPALARSLGQSMKILKKEVRSDKASDEGASEDSPADAQTRETGAAASAAGAPPPVPSAADEELARAKAEAAAAKAEADALRAAQQKRENDTA